MAKSKNISSKQKIRVVFLVALAALVAIFLFTVFIPDRKELSDKESKTPHFLDSTPTNGDVYAAQPINITINFDFDLSNKSSISVVDQDQQEWTAGETKIEDADTALKRDLKPDMPNGKYFINYTACWPDNSCHDGHFSFSIDSAKLSEYTDLRNQSEVTIDMKNIMFTKSKVIISPNTNVKWVNMDGTVHFVNTQTHPEHTYYPPHNSRSLEKGQSFDLTFETLGQYDYHCSAHAMQMQGSIVVAN